MPLTVEDLIDELEEWLEESEEIVESDPDGVLSPGDKAALQVHLANGEENIDIIVDPARQPNLDPSNAGSIDTSVSASTLATYASVCHNLAVEAKNEAHNSNGSDQVIGTKLKTIKNLLPGYRAAAGIN